MKLHFVWILSLSISLTQGQVLESLEFPKVHADLQKEYKFCIAHFPEIPPQNIHIKKKKQITPLSTTPSVLNVFRKKENWRYKIKISTVTIKILRPILYDSLSYKAQLGVLSHELSHVYDFQTHNKGYLFKALFWHFNPRKVDAFEYNTDRICIEQGMGIELLQWSLEVKQKLKIDAWKGKKMFEKSMQNERYMRPETICNYMSKYPTKYALGISTKCDSL